jgi:hypothetical protein
MNFVFLLYSTNFFMYMILLDLKPYVETDTIIFSGILKGRTGLGPGFRIGIPALGYGSCGRTKINQSRQTEYHTIDFTMLFLLS